MLYALKSVFPNRGCSGAPVGPAPIIDALKDGATVSTADWASSIPFATNTLSHICTRLRVDAFPVGSNAVVASS